MKINFTRYQHKRTKEIFDFVRVEENNRIVLMDTFGSEVTFSESTFTRWLKGVSNAPSRAILPEPTRKTTADRLKEKQQEPQPRQSGAPEVKLDSKEQLLVLLFMTDKNNKDGYESELSLSDIIENATELSGADKALIETKLVSLEKRGLIITSKHYDTIEFTTKATVFYKEQALIKAKSGKPTRAEKDAAKTQIQALTVTKEQPKVEPKPDKTAPAKVVKTPTKKLTNREQSISTDSINDNEVILMTFTGMVIGVYPIYKQTKDSIIIKTKKGMQKFSKETLIQLDANTPRFANKIVIKE